MAFKYGACIGKDAKMIAVLGDLGYEFCEVSFSALAEASDSELSAIYDECSARGVKCLSANCFIPGSIKVTGPDVDDEKINAYLEGAFSRISRLGIRNVIFGSAGARNLPEGFSRDEARRQIVHFLRDIVVPYAEKYDVIIGIEELNFPESNIINTCAEAMEYVREVDHPRIRLLVDYYHMGLMGESVQSLAGYKGCISHVHIASPSNGRHVPSPSDPEDYGEFFGILSKAGYEGGAISLEGDFAPDFRESARVAIEYLREVEAKLGK